jgi:hypothetical protein
VRKTLQEVARGERVRIPHSSNLFFSRTNWLKGMSHARSGGRVVDGSGPVRSRGSRQVPRALIVLRHFHIQSAIPCRAPMPRRRRRHGRPLPRMSPRPPQTNNDNKTRYFYLFNKLSRTEYTPTSHTMLHTHNA